MLGRRMLAGFFDLLLIFLLGFVVAALIGDFQLDEDTFEVSLSGVPFVIYVVLTLAYYFITEATSGQTLGKKLLKIRVVALHGERTVGKIAVRTVLRIIDGVFFYVVAILVIAVTRNRQRLGDLAAGTIVERVPDREEVEDPDRIPRM